MEPIVIIQMGTDTKISFKVNTEHKHISSNEPTFLITDSRSECLITQSELKGIINQLKILVMRGGD
jgi:hypothetical protein